MAPVFPDIWIDPGDQKKVDVRVRRVLMVTGRVLGPDGGPLVRAAVLIEPGIRRQLGPKGHLARHPLKRTIAEISALRMFLSATIT
jgi:hypothetical protein